MAKDDDKNKRVLRDTTKPEHRPSWGMSRDNAPKGAAAINWGDRGVPAPSPGGTGSRRMTGLFKSGVKTPARAPEPEKSPTSPKNVTGLFREQKGDDRATQVLKGASDRKGSRPAQETPRATIQNETKKPVFRKHGRDNDPDRGR